MKTNNNQQNAQKNSKGAAQKMNKTTLKNDLIRLMQEKGLLFGRMDGNGNYTYVSDNRLYRFGHMFNNYDSIMLFLSDKALRNRWASVEIPTWSLFYDEHVCEKLSSGEYSNAFDWCVSLLMESMKNKGLMMHADESWYKLDEMKQDA